MGEKTFAGAAERKMIAVVKAMRQVGERAVLVSLPFIGTDKSRAYYPSVVTSGDGVPVVCVATFRSKYLRKVFGPVFLAVFCLRHVRRGDTVILYNHAVEYFLALILLRIRGIQVVQDIEDVPIPEDRGVRGALSHLGFALTSRISARRKMIVADHVARGLGLEDYVVIRGVAHLDEAPTEETETKWATLREGGPLILHYGGTLRPDTGVDLFCAVVERLARDGRARSRPVVFNVTGTGEFDAIRALTDKIGSDAQVQVNVRKGLTKREYDALIDTCHASLSLRQPDANISNTTFPSKVIEITARGLALVSTDRGDVTTLFDSDNAFLLQDYSPEALAETIAGMAADPERVAEVATAGRQLCKEVFSPEAVGTEMKRLL